MKENLTRYQIIWHSSSRNIKKFFPTIIRTKVGIVLLIFMNAFFEILIQNHSFVNKLRNI